MTPRPSGSISTRYDAARRQRGACGRKLVSHDPNEFSRAIKMCVPLALLEDPPVMALGVQVVLPFLQAFFGRPVEKAPAVGVVQRRLFVHAFYDLFTLLFRSSYFVASSKVFAPCMTAGIPPRPPKAHST